MSFSIAKALARRPKKKKGYTLPTAISQDAALQRLAATGFAPRTVYDIGAYHGEWSADAARVFPAADYILFEANPDNAPYLERSGRRHFITALSAEDGEKEFFAAKHVVATGASLYRENTVHYAGENFEQRRIATARLDTIAAREKLPPPDFMKIDVQGAELDVLTGANEALGHCSALLLEISLLPYNSGAPLFDDVMAFTARAGLRSVDICELHHIAPGLLLQVDMLFVKDALFAKYCAVAKLPTR